MNCRAASRLLHRYFDEELPGELRNAVQEHLGSCVKCAAELGALAGLRNAVRALPETVPASDLWPRIQREIRTHPEVTIWEEAEPLFRRWVPLAAAALVAAVCVFFGLRRPTRRRVPIERQVASAVFASDEEAILLDGPISSDMVLRAAIYRHVEKAPEVE